MDHARSKGPIEGEWSFMVYLQEMWQWAHLAQAMQLEAEWRANDMGQAWRQAVNYAKALKGELEAMPQREISDVMTTMAEVERDREEALVEAQRALTKASDN
ncbi:hypothetical protein ACLOJK_021985 [Asimina triloba]